MAVNNPYAKYKEQSITTATPEELTLMLFNGCIKFMNLADVYMDEKDYEKINLNLQKAQNIITELNVTLNMDIPLSQNLRQLYEYIYEKLVEANMEKDKSRLTEAKELVGELRDAWKEAMALARKGN
ncbi:MAG: flagellar export chaperone FliS [Peptostreptococcaceae bacterium]|nr:flagellar export chaperone FliS [Peptostreptococcaceae bacterium]